MFTKYRVKIALALMIFMLFALLIDIYRFSPTGRATTADVTSQVDILVYFAITASANMTTEGVKFNVSSLPAIHANSTGSYGDAGPDENETMQNLTSSADSNVNINFCIKANGNLTSGGNIITIDNYKYSNDTTNNLTNPDIGNRKLLNTTFYPVSANIAPGGVENFRFWLNVSGGTSAGVYNNTLNFKGIQTGQAC